MKIRLTDEAKSRLHSISAHIALDSPARARTMCERILSRIGRIGYVPYAGRKVPEYEQDDLCEVFVRPYRVIYRVRPGVIEVLTIMHFRQLLPEDFGA